MPQNPYTDQQFLWRGICALLFIAIGVIALESGVSVSERPDVVDADILSKTYYSLSLFVIGGVELGTPHGGPLYGRVLLWLSYFGAPILAASTLLEALLRALAPQSWALRRLKNHVIIVGEGELPLSTLKVLRRHNSKIPVVVVTSNKDDLLAAELKQTFGAFVVTGDISHDFLVEQLRVSEARRVFLLGENSLRSYEAAANLIERVPGIADRVVIHCSRLRFMRSMENTAVAKQCEIFNTYHLAASALVRSHLIEQFRETHTRDIVVLAGFGRFGQTILEELQNSALDELETVAIIDQDARRRVLVADEQMQFSGDYRRELFEGDVAHPEVWDNVQDAVDITGGNVVFVLGTGKEEENLRTALWLRRQYPKAMVISRASKKSLFASQVGEEHNIVSISITQLVEDNLPGAWVRL